ncbi:MAG: hypothetical protein GY696_37290 [Gammaproteobacteria bacterium]|nr:hypothetical protein [Gammaproteobacteria bacterium]
MAKLEFSSRLKTENASPSAPNAVPMAKKLRSFPIAVEPLVSNELNKLEAQGIISQIDKSEWVQSIVAAKKKDSLEVRICGGMTSLNPYIIPDRFPLPNMKGKVLGVKYKTILIDYYSRWPEMLKIEKAPTSGQIVGWLKTVFGRFGNPEDLVSDNGTIFVSNPSC